MLSDVYDTYDTKIDKTNFFPKFDTASKRVYQKIHRI
jgi:hypothetical protein